MLRECLMLVFTNVIYNASLHCRYTTRNKILTKIFAVVMLLYLTFVTLHFFPNSHGCRQKSDIWLENVSVAKVDLYGFP